MPIKPLTALFVSLLILAGCAQTQTAPYAAPEHGDPAFLEGVNNRSDELYLNRDVSTRSKDFRNVYIAPANLTQLQIIQPEGAPVDEEWRINAAEESVLQQTIATEFTHALSYESAFNIVDSRDKAEIVVNTTVVAIHPNETRAAIAAGATPGGSITVSIALVDTQNDSVMVRAVDTRSSDNIWAFHQVNNDSSVDVCRVGAVGYLRRGFSQQR